MKNKINFILIGIIILASILRLWGLGNVPPSPDWDEVALGYNAYSIMQTGRDEYGKVFPVVLQSFDDYKPAFYAYSIIPFIPFFDVSILSVRLPSAIFGILTVLATYFLAYELFKRKDIALITAFLLAISPWHIQFSRVAFETNTGLAFNVFGVLFFLKGLKKPWFLSLSAISFVLGIYVYQSEKVFAPLLLLTLVLIYGKEFFSLAKKYLISAVLIGIVLAAPMLYYIATDKNALLRAKGVSIFSEPTPLLQKNQIKLLDDSNTKNILGEIFDNRRMVYAKEIAANYIVHYNLNWLFITGDLKRHHAPGIGNLYFWELPFLLIGLYVLLFSSFSKKTKLLIFAWFLLAPVPASITTGVPHAVRTLNFLPTFQVFIAVGLVTVYQYVLKNKILKILAIGYVFFAIFNFVYYLNQYFVQQNYFNSEDWQYGYAKVIPTIKENENKYSKIIVTSQPPLDQSYMFFLFYLKYPPKQYQEEGNLTAGFRENHKFGKYEFRPIDLEKEKKTADIILVGREADFPLGDIIVKKGIIKKVNYLNGDPAILVVKGS